VLYLTEPVSLQFSQIKLYDRSRKALPLGPPDRDAGQDTTVKVVLPGPLQPGIYTVAWRVMSTIDGHPTEGVFRFQVSGEGGGLAPTEQSAPDDPGVNLLSSSTDTADEKPDPIRLIVRWVMLAGAAIVLGGALFTVGVIEPAASEDRAGGGISDHLLPALSARFGYLGGAVAVVLVLALVAELVGQVAAIGDTDYPSALAANDLAWVLLTSTRYGLAWALKMLASILLVPVMIYAWRRRGAGPKLGPTPWDLTVSCGSLLLLGEAIGSHAAAAGSGHAAGHALGLPLPVLSDWLHLVMAAAWAGGLAYMVLVLFPTFRAMGVSYGAGRAFLGRSVPRFSRLAVVSVLVLSGTGTYNLLVHSADFGSILESGYGQVLVIKLGLFISLICLGAFNLLWVSPRLRRQAEAAGSDVGGQLRRNVLVEVVLVLLVVGCAALLTLLPPPSQD
jgi:copper transport protein